MSQEVQELVCKQLMGLKWRYVMQSVVYMWQPRYISERSDFQIIGCREVAVGLDRAERQ